MQILQLHPYCRQTYKWNWSSAQKAILRFLHTR